VFSSEWVGDLIVCAVCCARNSRPSKIKERVMSIVLYHHPFSRAATTVWMLEEVGVPYELRYVDMQARAHKEEAHRERNRMMKLPVIEDDGVAIAEGAAIAVYLGDRYGAGELAPALDDPRRGAYLRWCFFGPSVLEPACMAKQQGWEYNPGSAGFGTYEDTVATLDEALGQGPWLMGDAFTMADTIVGGTALWLLRFGILEGTERIGAWAERLEARPARARAEARNQAIITERGLGS